jgi:hypothetical protein
MPDYAKQENPTKFLRQKNSGKIRILKPQLTLDNGRLTGN